MQFHSGRIVYGGYDEGEALKLGDEFLVRLLEEYHQQQVWCCFAFSTEPLTKQDFLEIAIQSAEGTVEAGLGVSWSETTGFLWVDETGMVGGHDLVALFDDHETQFGALLIDTKPLDLTELTND